jgi:2-(1,2-epoxy-1,2-dihydrophenyl)acetyl-CoA isomerase
MSEELKYRKDEAGVAVITLDRPASLNALTVGLLEQLLARVTEAAEDATVGCVVLTGAGRGFCAGGDVRDQVQRSGEAASGAPPAGLEPRIAQLRKYADISRLLFEMPKPTIAMLNGVAAGAGMSLALACDMRMAGESARMTTAFAKVGLAGDLGGTYFLNRLVGPTKARELYFTSEMLDVRQLQALGLVNWVVADAALEAECMALATRLARGPRVAWGYMKRNFKVAEQGDLGRLLDIESDGMIRTGQSADHREASRAFVEKRPPQFQGR